MPTITEIQEKLKTFQTLLREGRVQEVDTQVNELGMALVAQLEKEKAESPPPSPLTPEEWLLLALDTINAKLGNDPKLESIIKELRPKPAAA